MLDQDMDLGEVGSMRDLGVTESYKLKKQVVVSASEAAEMILRYVDYSYGPFFVRSLFDPPRVVRPYQSPLTLCSGWTTSFAAHRGGERGCEIEADRAKAHLHAFCAIPRGSWKGNKLLTHFEYIFAISFDFAE